MHFSRIPDRQSRNTDLLRVMTYNVYGVAAHWEQRRSVLADGFRQLSPDVLALQETVLTDSFHQAPDLLGGDYKVVNSRARLPDEWGASIASQWPIVDVRELDQLVTRRSEIWCTTLIAEIDAPDPFGPLVFVNHFQS